MMILSPEELPRTNIAVSNVNLIYQRPAYRHIPMNERLVNGFLYVTGGKCVYTTKHGRRLELNENMVIYLPRGGYRALDIDPDGVEFYRVDFEIMKENEFVLFSADPIILAKEVNAKFKECISALEIECKYENNNLAKVQWLLGALAALLPHPSSVYHSRLGPAIKYIDDHFTEQFDSSLLANLCYLGTAQFYSLFHEKFGKTPLEYRDDILLRHAKLLLESGENSVSEVSDTLGFSSVAYFSRFFKRHLGISPTGYIARQRQRTQ